MPKGSKYVGRPTRWGNPFTLGMVVDRVRLGHSGFTSIVEIRVETAQAAVDYYRRWLAGTPLLVGGHDLALTPPTTAEIKAALAGADLSCWCRLGQPCHGDVLLEIANGEL